MNQTLDNPGFNVTLRGQLVEECAAMAKYALASGLNVPGGTIESLEAFTGEKLTQEGKEKPRGEQSQMDLNIKQLNAVHYILARIVAPAKPRTILLLEKEDRKKGLFKFLGPVPFIRRMMLAALKGSKQVKILRPETGDGA